MAEPLDVQDRVRLHLEELGANHDFDGPDGALSVPLADAGIATVEFQDIEWDTLVLLSTTLIEDLDIGPADAIPLSEWTVGFRGAKLCLDPEDGVLTARTELLGSFIDPPEVGFALAALHQTLEWAPDALDLVGGRVPRTSGSANDPAAWWPEGKIDPPLALDRVRSMVSAEGTEPLLDADGALTFLTNGALLIVVEPSPDGNFIELRARLVENIDPTHPAVSETLTTNCRIAFGGLSAISTAREVVVEHDLLTSSLDSQEFFAALNSVADVADGFCDSIAEALQGQPARVLPEAYAKGTSSWGSSFETSTGGTASGLRVTPGEYVGLYEIEDELGSGTFGTVYRAKDPRLPRSVALKVLKPQLVFEDAARDRFLKEARLAALVNHPHLVKVHDVGESDPFVYVAYDLVDGEPLDRLIRDAGALDPDRVVRLVGQVAGALQALHDEGIVHRDVKPANLMVWRPGSALEAAIVLDLGVAHGYETPDAIRLTTYAEGTPYYQGPEAESGVWDDPRLDQYALAATAFELIAGTPVFGEPSSRYDLQERKRSMTLESLEHPGANMPRVEQVLGRALDPEPAKRFETIEQFAEALDEAVLRSQLGEFEADRASARGATSSGSAARGRLSPYVVWTAESETVPDPLTAPVRELAKPLVRIVETEGPVVAERAFRLMLEGSGRRQLSSGIEKRLASAVRKLVRDEQIEAEQEWGGRKPRDAVLRPAGGALVHPRELGPRRLDEVPPRELAATAAVAVGQPQSLVTDDVIRSVLALYGRQRASRAFIDQLENALSLYGEEVRFP